MMKTVDWTIGTTVRAKVAPHDGATSASTSGPTRRAVIATLQQDGAIASVLWEDDAPVPLPGPPVEVKERHPGSKFLVSRPFLVTPVLERSQEDVESNVPTAQLMPLLDFESGDPDIEGPMKDNAADDLLLMENPAGCLSFMPLFVNINCGIQRVSHNKAVQIWKDRGDQLLRLGDSSAAIVHYEMALKLSCMMLQVGSDILLRIGGNVQVATVDDWSPDGNKSLLDVHLIESGNDQMVKCEQVLLALMDPDKEHFQERILLNMARCLLQLAETTFVPHGRRPAYLRSGILATTMALAITAYYQRRNKEATQISSTNTTALLLRSKAFIQLGKYPQAQVDLKKVLAQEPGNKEALGRMEELERRREQHKKSEKKLVKHICSWVQTATKDPVSETDDAIERQVTLSPLPPVSKNAIEKQSTSNLLIYMFSFLVIVFAWIAQKNLAS